MEISIRVVDESSKKLWDEIVSESPQGSVFHSWKWLKITEKYANSRFIPIVEYKDGDPVGVFPLFYQKKYFLNMIFSPPPHTGMLFLGPAIAGYDSLRQERKEQYLLEFQRLVDSYITHTLKGNYTAIALPYGLSDPRPFTWTGYGVEQYFDYTTCFNGTIDDMWLKFKSKLRKDIQRAEKRGIYVEEGGKNELITIYRLLQERYREQNKIVKVPIEYLLELYDGFTQNFRIFVAKYHDDIVTGTIEIIQGDSIFSWIGCPKPKDSSIQAPNEVLTWEVMKYAYAQGLKCNIQLGTGGDARLAKYYSKFNRTLRVRYFAKKSSFVPSLMEGCYHRILQPVQSQCVRLFYR